MAGGSSASDSILPFLPPLVSSSSDSLQWPSKMEFALKALARGPVSSKVDCGEELCDCITDMREQIGLAPLSLRSGKGLCLYFDDLITRAAASGFYEAVLPVLADLVFRMPLLLEAHFKQAKGSVPSEKCKDTKSTDISVKLRLLCPQQAGLVLLDQEFVGSLLACAFFCLYPSHGRQEAQLPYMNFDYFFAGINGKTRSQEQKMTCIVHYFCRISEKMPQGRVSYERKVIPQPHSGPSPFPFYEPDYSFWNESVALLCPFKIFEKGMIEDEKLEAVEVDFANVYLGGGVLFSGCVQEEIRFCINPELIVGMLFLPALANNEAIEIIGAERFSCYEGYGSSFTFIGDYLDVKPRDLWGRLQTRIVAIDALDHPGENQFHCSQMLRETNKAFCGFLDHSGFRGYFEAMDLSCTTRCLSNQLRGEPTKPAQDSQCQENSNVEERYKEEESMCGHVNPASQTMNDVKFYRDSASIELLECSENVASGIHNNAKCGVTGQGNPMHVAMPNRSTQICKVGIATGNWGCGAFGGDIELKSLLQWIAASQAGRPFVHYYTFGDQQTQRLHSLTEWILKEGWHVGDCWDLLMEYGEKRVNKKVKKGLPDWILPEVLEGQTSSGLITYEGEDEKGAIYRQ
eukprot:c28133_g1_i2 orf=76-1968(+)